MASFTINSIAVFCGSGCGTDLAYRDAAMELGSVLASQNIRLVYGGSKTGLMGAVADSMLRNGGAVTGVIPFFLQTKEIVHEGLTELVLVDTMHERKLKMHELSDAIITLPGGFGTMEEMFEMLTWAQLGLHKKPIGLLNTLGFYNSLRELSDRMVREGFLKEINRDMLLISESIPELLEKMKSYVAPEVPEWITPETS